MASPKPASPALTFPWAPPSRLLPTDSSCSPACWRPRGFPGGPGGHPVCLLFGTCEAQTIFQRPLSPDLLASPDLNDNKTYVSKQRFTPGKLSVCLGPAPDLLRDGGWGQGQGQEGRPVEAPALPTRVGSGMKATLNHSTSMRTRATSVPVVTRGPSRSFCKAIEGITFVNIAGTGCPWLARHLPIGEPSRGKSGSGI